MERPARKKSLLGAHVALEGEADAQNEDEVDQHDEPVDDGKIHGSLWYSLRFEMCAKSLWYWGKLYIVSGVAVQMCRSCRRDGCGTQDCR